MAMFDNSNILAAMQRNIESRPDYQGRNNWGIIGEGLNNIAGKMKKYADDGLAQQQATADRNLKIAQDQRDYDLNLAEAEFRNNKLIYDMGQDTARQAAVNTQNDIRQKQYELNFQKYEDEKSAPKPATRNVVDLDTGVTTTIEGVRNPSGEFVQKAEPYVSAVPKPTTASNAQNMLPADIRATNAVNEAALLKGYEKKPALQKDLIDMRMEYSQATGRPLEISYIQDFTPQGARLVKDPVFGRPIYELVVDGVPYRFHAAQMVYFRDKNTGEDVGYEPIYEGVDD